jgi:hypothetical protein
VCAPITKLAAVALWMETVSRRLTAQAVLGIAVASPSTKRESSAKELRWPAVALMVCDASLLELERAGSVFRRENRPSPLEVTSRDDSQQATHCRSHSTSVTTSVTSSCLQPSLTQHRVLIIYSTIFALALY